MVWGSLVRVWGLGFVIPPLNPAMMPTRQWIRCSINGLRTTYGSTSANYQPTSPNTQCQTLSAKSRVGKFNSPARACLLE